MPIVHKSQIPEYLQDSEFYESTQSDGIFELSEEHYREEIIINSFEDLIIYIRILDFWLVNKHALGDEVNEMFDAIGGINDGIGSAGWKYWKGKNKETETMKISDLSEGDKLELYYEWIDGLHFYMNFAISMGMTSKDIVNLYMAKNSENHDRQERGY